MQKRKLTILLLCAALLPAELYAQAYEVKFNKKIIYTDSLNVPRNTSSYTLLNFLPEMLQRPGSFLFDNYDVQIEGMSVGGAADVALEQLMIDDIEKIEIEESPLKSYQKNGVGGSINLVLRSQGKKTDQLWGSASTNLQYPTGAMPQIVIGHRSGKFMVRGLILSDIYDNVRETETKTISPTGDLTTYNRRSSDYKFRTEMARAYLQYNPTENDVVKLDLSQTYTYEYDLKEPTSSNVRPTEVKSSGTDLHARLNYEHLFTRNKLATEVQYKYNPGNDQMDIPVQTESRYLYNNNYKYHNVWGQAEFVAAMLPASDPKTLTLKAGSNFNALYKNDNREYTLDKEYLDLYNPYSSTFFVQPYLVLEYTAGKLRMKAEGQYQHYNITMDRGENPYTITSNDFTGQLMAEWHFTPHKNLRLLADRKLSRPSEQQQYPFLYYDTSSQQYSLGNASLVPTLSHEIRLDYIADYKWGEHSLITDASASYNHTNNLIKSKKVQDQSKQEEDYITYVNEGTRNTLNANLMALYSYRSFTLSFTSNLYHSHFDEDHYTYYNVSFYPQFAMKDGWQGGAKLTYFSKVQQKNTTLSDCASVILTLGRQWKGLYIYAFNTVVLQKHAEDVTVAANGSQSIKIYEMIPNNVGAGIKYTF